MKDIRYSEVRDNINNSWNMCLLEFTDFDLYGFELDRMVLSAYKSCQRAGLHWNCDSLRLIKLTTTLVVSWQLCNFHFTWPLFCKTDDGTNSYVMTAGYSCMVNNFAILVYSFSVVPLQSSLICSYLTFGVYKQQPPYPNPCAKNDRLMGCIYCLVYI